LNHCIKPTQKTNNAQKTQNYYQPTQKTNEEDSRIIGALMFRKHVIH
jgi:hypothetical protein